MSDNFKKAAWEPCQYCDEFICNIHGIHVADCECPPIEEWVENEVFPYEPGSSLVDISKFKSNINP